MMQTASAELHASGAFLSSVIFAAIGARKSSWSEDANIYAENRTPSLLQPLLG